jgi:glycosyltransferase involved in cell wall biosynthesis
MKLTFYGHFSGESSFPVVSQALLSWMRSRDYDVQPVNLRDSEDRDVDVSSPALLFGFPSWYEDIPKHRQMIGYHVPDVLPAPPSWGPVIRDRCSDVLTPSTWCKRVLECGGIGSVSVVRHGVDPRVFRPSETEREGPILLRHYCSSETMERKGTVELLKAASSLLTHKFSTGPVILRASVPPSTILRVRGFQREFAGGSIEIVSDEPRSQEEFAEELRSVSAVVQPSRAEGFGLIPLQAIACGVPVIMTDATGHAEYAEDIEDATLFVRTGALQSAGGGRAPALSSRSLSSHLATMIVNHERLTKNARAVAEGVRRAWSWENVLDKDLAPVLDRVLLAP